MKNYPRYKRYDLGRQPGGTIVEIALSCVNNVRLMDHANFLRYTEARSYKCIGGRTETSPTRLAIPLTGHWHVVVDKIGFQALANSNVRAILPKSAWSPVTGGAAGISISGSVTGELIGSTPSRADSEARSITGILDELDSYKQIANTDALTGLANRRAFDIKMQDIFEDSRTSSDTALILCDIDHFKSFNDTHGHAIGDTVLKIVAETIRTALPDNALAARIGGEEFAIVVEGASQQDVEDIAESTRQAIQTTKCVDAETGTDCGMVTISLGICMANQAITISDLCHKCDLALYASKRNGRDRSTIFDESMMENPKSDVLSPPNQTKDRRRTRSKNSPRNPIELRL